MYNIIIMIILKLIIRWIVKSFTWSTYSHIGVKFPTLMTRSVKAAVWFFFGIMNNKFLSATSLDGFSLSWCCKMPQTPHNMAPCAQPMKQQLSPPFSPVKNNEAKKHKRKSTSVEQFYDEEAVSQPSAPSETVACRYLRPAGDSLSKSCCWLFPMSESSAPAAPPAAHSWFVLDFMVHGGPLLFPRGDYGAGQMASRMHLGTAVAPASTPGLASTYSQAGAKHRPTHGNTSRRLSGSEQSTTGGDQVTAIKAAQSDCRCLCSFQNRIC